MSEKIKVSTDISVGAEVFLAGLLLMWVNSCHPIHIVVDSNPEKTETTK